MQNGATSRGDRRSWLKNNKDDAVFDRIGHKPA